MRSALRKRLSQRFLRNCRQRDGRCTISRSLRGMLRLLSSPTRASALIQGLEFQANNLPNKSNAELLGFIDSAWLPSDSDLTKMQFGGWLLHTQARIATLAVHVSGAEPTLIDYHLPSTDVAAVFGDFPFADACRFEALVSCPSEITSAITLSFKVLCLDGTIHTGMFEAVIPLHFNGASDVSTELLPAKVLLLLDEAEASDYTQAFCSTLPGVLAASGLEVEKIVGSKDSEWLSASRHCTEYQMIFVSSAAQLDFIARALDTPQISLQPSIFYIAGWLTEERGLVATPNETLIRTYITPNEAVGQEIFQRTGTRCTVIPDPNSFLPEQFELHQAQRSAAS